MKRLKYKIFAITLLLGIGLQAQTYNKTIKENFDVNSNVQLVIDTDNTDVTVETWNKNTVSVEAVMEVEGVDKKEAGKILTKWKFEALGNKSMVKITSASDNMDFNFPDLDIDIPDFDMPDIDFSDMDFDIPDIEEIEFDYIQYKNDSTYLKRYKNEVATQVEKFKNSSWKVKMDSLRNSEEVKQAIAESKRAIEQAKMEIMENNKVWKEQAKMAKEASIEAKKMLEEMKANGMFDSIQNFSENIYFNRSNSKNSQIKIKKYIKINVPKNATFKLNVRHGKLDIPNSNNKMSLNMSYGDFVGGTILGGRNELTIASSPIVINTLQSANITLKNVPNAMFGTFSNVNLFSNYSDVVIKMIGENNAVSSKFGNLEIVNSIEQFKQMNIILDYSKGIVNLSNTTCNFQISNKQSDFKINSKFKVLSNKTINNVQLIDGFNINKTSTNKLFLTSVYSSGKLN